MKDTCSKVFVPIKKIRSIAAVNGNYSISPAHHGRLACVAAAPLVVTHSWLQSKQRADSCSLFQSTIRHNLGRADDTEGQKRPTENPEHKHSHFKLSAELLKSPLLFLKHLAVQFNRQKDLIGFNC